MVEAVSDPVIGLDGDLTIVKSHVQLAVGDCLEPLRNKLLLGSHYVGFCQDCDGVDGKRDVRLVFRIDGESQGVDGLLVGYLDLPERRKAWGKRSKRNESKLRLRKAKSNKDNALKVENELTGRGEMSDVEIGVLGRVVGFQTSQFIDQICFSRQSQSLRDLNKNL